MALTARTVPHHLVRMPNSLDATVVPALRTQDPDFLTLVIEQPGVVVSVFRHQRALLLPSDTSHFMRTGFCLMIMSQPPV